MGLSKKCDHLRKDGKPNVAVGPYGLSKHVRVFCGTCMKMGPFSDDWQSAEKAFWKQEREEDLEKFTADFINKLAEVLKPEYIRSLVKGAEMYVPSDPHEAYRFGVKQATEPMTDDNPAYNDPEFECLTTQEFVNRFLADRRKSMLTKKVTKWVAVYNVNKPGVAPCFTSHVFDTFDQANKDSGNVPVVAVTPIEIELPL